MRNAQTLDPTSENKSASSSTIDWSGLSLGKDSLKWSGGFADVYVAEHPKLGPLALKRPRGPCHPGSLEYRHLEKEVAIWKNLIHTNVLPFIGIYEEGQAIYIVSPFLQNGTVTHYISVNPGADRVGFIRDLAKGLNYLHEHGIIHGDIKGSNLLVSSSVPVEGVVADFGLARLVDTQTATSLQGAGTPRWQSPELSHGQSRSFQSDVYAFGMTVYEIISGQIPFAEVPYYAVLFKVLNKERPLPVPRFSLSGYQYTREWSVAQTAWDHDPKCRPTMNRILELLNAPTESRGFVEARIRVVCEEMPEYSGYVSRTLNEPYGSLVVTQDLSDALIVAWDPQQPEPQPIAILNGRNGQTWLALRFTADKPDYQLDIALWATFTTASGSKRKFDTIWTRNSPGLDLLPEWSVSGSNELNPYALGEPLEVGLTFSLQSYNEPPHIFFCFNLSRYWRRVPGHAAASLVLDVFDSEDSTKKA